MIDRLPPVAVRVEGETESVFGDSLRLCDLCGHTKEMTGKGLLRLPNLKNIGQVPFRDYEDVEGRLGVDIVEGDALVILVNRFYRDDLVDEIAEETL